MLSDAKQTDELAGKTAIVTGSSRGIGREIAGELAAAGADVAVNYHSSEEEAKEVASEIESLGQSAVVEQADVSEIEDVRGMADSIHDQLGPVDILVNNAGITIDRTFGNLTPEDWRRVIDINLNGVYYCTETFFDDIREAEHGRIINISSVIGQMGNVGQANYAASKSGLFGLTRTLAKELAGEGATVNAVAPGFVRTEMVEAVPERVQETLLEDIPLGRFGEPEEIAAVVHFLARERSAYITGQVIGINGGMYV